MTAKALSRRRARNVGRIIAWTLIDTYLREGNEPDPVIAGALRQIAISHLTVMGDAALALAEKDYKELSS